MSAAHPGFAWRFDDNLREVPADAAAFGAALDLLVEEIATTRSHPQKLLDALGEMAPLLRIGGRLEDARKTAAEAVALADMLDDSRAVFVNQLRLAHVFHWEGHFELATPLFDQLASQARSMAAFADLLDTTLQHAGRNLFDQGRLAEAARCFREALELRGTKGDAKLVEDSRLALQVTTQRQRALEPEAPLRAAGRATDPDGRRS